MRSRGVSASGIKTGPLPRAVVLVAVDAAAVAGARRNPHSRLQNVPVHVQDPVFE